MKFLSKERRPRRQYNDYFANRNSTKAILLIITNIRLQYDVCELLVTLEFILLFPLKFSDIIKVFPCVCVWSENLQDNRLCSFRTSRMCERSSGPTINPRTYPDEQLNDSYDCAFLSETRVHKQKCLILTPSYI